MWLPFMAWLPVAAGLDCTKTDASSDDDADDSEYYYYYCHYYCYCYHYFSFLNYITTSTIFILVGCCELQYFRGCSCVHDITSRTFFRPAGDHFDAVGRLWP